jgi:hypothetical protein
LSPSPIILGSNWKHDVVLYPHIYNISLSIYVIAFYVPLYSLQVILTKRYMCAFPYILGHFKGWNFACAPIQISIMLYVVYLKMRCHKCIADVRWKDPICCCCGWNISHFNTGNSDYTHFQNSLVKPHFVCWYQGFHIIKWCSLTCNTTPNLIVLTNKYIIAFTSWVFKTCVLVPFPALHGHFEGKVSNFEGREIQVYFWTTNFPFMYHKWLETKMWEL